MRTTARTASRTAAALALLLTAGAAHAHEFWIRPAAFRATPGQTVDVRLFVGDGYPGEPVARNGPKIAAFAAHGPRATLQIPGDNADEPAGRFTPDAPGTWVLAFRNLPSRVELDAEKFEDYLRTDGLEHVIDLRAQRGWSDAPGREIYSRCAKALVRVHHPDGSLPASDDPALHAFDRDAGLRFDLSPTHDPFALIPGDDARDDLTVRATFDGAPLAHAKVSARTPDDPTLVISARTGPDGLATLELPHAGEWLISSVHMTDAPAGSDAEWESTWASLVFEIPTPTTTTGAAPSDDARAVAHADPHAPALLCGTPGL